MHLSVIYSLIAAHIAIASPITGRSSYALKERHLLPRGWSEVARAHGSTTLNLQIGLKHRNQDLLEQHLLEISNPSHERYGRYLSATEVNDMIGPSDDAVDLVKTWLLEHNITSTNISPARDWINVPLSIEKIEELLDTRYNLYQHEDGSLFSRTTEWSLPEYLHEHIEVIQPTTSFFRTEKRAVIPKPDRHSINWHHKDWWKQPHKQPSRPGASCDVTALCNVTGTNLAGATVTATTLDCLRCLYGTIDYIPKVPTKNAIGVTNYLNEVCSQDRAISEEQQHVDAMKTQKRTDIQRYLQDFRPEAAGVAYEFPIYIVADGQDQQTPLDPIQIANELDLEGDLDGELAIGISWPTSFVAWSTGGTDDDIFLIWLNYVLSQDTVPHVISTSYGDDEQALSYSLATRICNGFKQLAARGVSVMISSGDDGVGANGTCFSNTDPSKAMFLPDFPASCPWVTAVGATQGYAPETAVSRYGSGAGFSNYFGQPAYQTAAVEGYLDKIGGLYAGLYNRSGRGYPDVAALGNHDVIVWASNITTIGGTSASSPTFAAIVALVNDALITANKPPLGFLNPWIYNGAFTALTDILSGSAIGCNVSGFPAEVGWDAVTGFGTPNFDKLVAAAFGNHRM